MNEEEQEIRYTISQIADELDISTRTIRFYEEKGLIKPQRTSGNQRIYTPRNKARLKLILRGKRLGTDVTEIEQIEKSLKFGEAKLKEIKDRKKELTLLEQDILSTREKLMKRLNEIKKDFSHV
jgi:DNA-binding transcriptional MerR regulator